MLPRLEPRRKPLRCPWVLPVLAASLLAGCTREDAGAGQKLFLTYCSACHQAEGLGTENGPPPLAGSSWVTGPESRLIRIVLHGVRGSLTVAGKTYNLEMPGFGRILDDGDIASVLSHVRRRFGGPSPRVLPAAVRRVRAETAGRTTYWTAGDLLEIP